MAFTIILAPVALILLLVLGLGGLLGLAGIAAAIDAQLDRRRGWRAGYGSIACAATLNAAPLVPVIGLLATVLVATAALGAVGLSVQRARTRAVRSSSTHPSGRRSSGWPSPVGDRDLAARGTLVSVDAVAIRLQEPAARP